MTAPAAPDFVDYPYDVWQVGNTLTVETLSPDEGEPGEREPRIFINESDSDAEDSETTCIAPLTLQQAVQLRAALDNAIQTTQYRQAIHAQT